jgi:hypothetical protein
LSPDLIKIDHIYEFGNIHLEDCHSFLLSLFYIGQTQVQACLVRVPNCPWKFTAQMYQWNMKINFDSICLISEISRSGILPSS